MDIIIILFDCLQLTLIGNFFIKCFLKYGYLKLNVVFIKYYIPTCMYAKEYVFDSIGKQRALSLDLFEPQQVLKGMQTMVVACEYSVLSTRLNTCLFYFKVESKITRDFEVQCSLFTYTELLILCYFFLFVSFPCGICARSVNNDFI